MSTQNNRLHKKLPSDSRLPAGMRADLRKYKKKIAKAFEKKLLSHLGLW